MSSLPNGSGQSLPALPPDTSPITSPLYDIPLREGNPRNSEGAFLTLKDGRILFVYSRFVGVSDRDCSETHLIRLVSADGGLGRGEVKVLEDDENSGFCYTAIHYNRRVRCLPAARAARSSTMPA